MMGNCLEKKRDTNEIDTPPLQPRNRPDNTGNYIKLL